MWCVNGTRNRYLRAKNIKRNINYYYLKTMSDNKISRKDFLSVTAMLGAGAMLGGAATSLTSCSKAPKYTPLREAGEYYIPELTDMAIDGRELKVGVIGCGGRGSGAVMDTLAAANGIKVWALGDVFQEKIGWWGRRRHFPHCSPEIPDRLWPAAPPPP